MYLATAAMFLSKPRKDKQQHILLTDGLKEDFTCVIFFAFDGIKMKILILIENNSKPKHL